jgi:hypothetical protein
MNTPNTSCSRTAARADLVVSAVTATIALLTFAGYASCRNRDIESNGDPCEEELVYAALLGAPAAGVSLLALGSGLFGRWQANTCEDDRAELASVAAERAWTPDPADEERRERQACVKDRAERMSTSNTIDDDVTRAAHVRAIPRCALSTETPDEVARDVAQSAVLAAVDKDCIAATELASRARELSVPIFNLFAFQRDLAACLTTTSSSRPARSPAAAAP